MARRLQHVAFRGSSPGGTYWRAPPYPHLDGYKGGHMSSTRNPGRVAGFLYLLLMAAPLRLVYIPSKLFVSGNATETADKLAAHETTFRPGIAADLFSGI